MKRTKFSVFLAGFLFVLIFCCGSASATTINVDNSTTNAIGSAVTNAQAGDTLNLSAGTYNEHSIIIDKNLTITGPVTNDTPTAIIDAEKSNSVFHINSDVTVYLNYLTIQNGQAINGGGIYNAGTITMTNSTINNNTATTGGGIYNIGTGTINVTNSNINNNTATAWGGGGIDNSGTVTVTNSNINNNKATGYGGGGIFNEGTVSVTNSNINNNTATTGGGIYNYDAFTFVGCDFTSNQASKGNAIYNANSDAAITKSVHFSRFYDVAGGYEIYNDGGSVDARYNWWGSNSNPISKVYGSVDVSSWLVLSVDADNIFIGKNNMSNITANLLFDSNGVYHDPSAGHIPDGTKVTFYSLIGIINPTMTASNGSATSTLTTGNTSGLDNVYAICDRQYSQTSIIIDATTPTVTSIDPANNTVINNTSKAVKITFNEAVQKGTAFNNITLTLNGTTIPITTALNGNILTITKTGSYANGLYTINLPANALMDAAGNNIASYTSKFTIDTIPPMVSVSNPTNGKTGVKRSQTITVTFNENILAGSNYSKITLKSSTGKTITITKSISGKVLTIKHSALAAKTKYTLTLYSGSITDQAGNPLATKTITFTTGST